jgi:hypothetical protein
MYEQPQTYKTHLKMEMQLQHSSIKTRPEALFMGMLPLTIYYSERNVLVRSWSNEAQNDRVGESFISFDFVGGGFRLVDKVGVEDVEFVTLYNL